MISVYIRHNGPWEVIGTCDSWKEARLLLLLWSGKGYYAVAKGCGIQSPQIPPS